MVDPRDVNVRARARHEERIRKALEHLEANLTRTVPLAELAEVAGFDPFHFHRVFTAAVGETPHDHALRLRLEQAAYRLKHSRRGTMTELALELGFSESSAFSRAFRAHFGVTPTAFRRDPRSPRRARMDGSFYKPWHTDDAVVADNPDGFRAELAHEPARDVAYVRVLGHGNAAGLTEALGVLRGWAERYGQAGPLIAMSPDDPDLTSLAEYRFEWCVPVRGSPPAEGAVGIRRLPGGTVARLRVTGDIDKVARAWDWLFRAWLPESGHEPRGAPSREDLLDDGRGAPAHFDLVCVLPVRRHPRR